MSTINVNQFCFLCNKPLTVAEMIEAGHYPPQSGNMDDWEPITCHRCIKSKGLLDSRKVHKATHNAKTYRQTKSSLPPDPEGQNADRAEWAHRAILTFEDATGTEREDALADLLCDLMHWADVYGQDFDRELSRATDYYSEETDPGDGVPNA